MPKVRRSRKQPPDGWELIEPTLEELEQKMREGNFFKKNLRLCFLINNDLFQLKPNPMKENVLMNHCGQFLKFIIKNLVIYTIYFIEEKLLVVSYTITV